MPNTSRKGGVVSSTCKKLDVANPFTWTPKQLAKLVEVITETIKRYRRAMNNGDFTLFRKAFYWHISDVLDCFNLDPNQFNEKDTAAMAWLKRMRGVIKSSSERQWRAFMAASKMQGYDIHHLLSTFLQQSHLAADNWT